MFCITRSVYYYQPKYKQWMGEANNLLRKFYQLRNVSRTNCRICDYLFHNNNHKLNLIYHHGKGIHYSCGTWKVKNYWKMTNFSNFFLSFFRFNSVNMNQREKFFKQKLVDRRFPIRFMLVRFLKNVKMLRKNKKKLRNKVRKSEEKR